MALGPGKYDNLATAARIAAGADAVIVMVIGGARGDGFSVQAPVDITGRLPALLRAMADDIERSLEDGGSN